MAKHIDGFVLPIPRSQLDTYKKVAEAVAEIWKEHGALTYQEYASESMHLEGTRSFAELAGAKEDEIVLFGWVEFDSMEARDRANRGVASDPRMPALVDPLTSSARKVFDATRMAYGRFQVLV